MKPRLGLAFLFLFIGFSAGEAIAAEDASEKAYQDWLNSLDLSFLEAPYAACKVKTSSSQSLSPKENCLISKLSARCSAADDCLVQCIAKGNDGKVGGGCWHLCFAQKFNLWKWSKPKNMGVCSKLPSSKNGS